MKRKIMKRKTKSMMKSRIIQGHLPRTLRSRVSLRGFNTIRNSKVR